MLQSFNLPDGRWGTADAVAVAVAVVVDAVVKIGYADVTAVVGIPRVHVGEKFGQDHRQQN